MATAMTESRENGECLAAILLRELREGAARRTTVLAMLTVAPSIPPPPSLGKLSTLSF
jgi:hypothetical protein